MENIYETKANKDFVERIVNLDSNLIKVSTYLYDNYNVELEVTDEDEITLKASDGCINESQSLLDAKEYVEKNIDLDFYKEILFI